MNVTNTNEIKEIVKPSTEVKLPEEINNDDDGSIIAEKVKKPRGQKSGQVGENTKKALEAGRAKLKENWERKRKEKAELMEKYATKKANAKLKEKLKIKKAMGCEDLSSDEEEPIQVIKETKPKKKQTIIIKEESDDEEIIVKKAPKKKVEEVSRGQEPQPQPQPQKPIQRLFFY